MSATFAEEYTHVVKFQTVISCNGCSDEEAFATEYPESFGDLTDGDFRRKLRFDGSRILDAGLVLDKIERKLNFAVPNIGRIGEAFVSAEQDAPAKKMRSAYYNEEVVSSPSTLPKDDLYTSANVCYCFLFFDRVEKRIAWRFLYQSETTTKPSVAALHVPS